MSGGGELTRTGRALLDCARRGMTRIQAARAVGCSENYVYTMCKAHPDLAATFTARGRVWVTDEERAIVRAAIADGMTRPEIGRATGWREGRLHVVIAAVRRDEGIGPRQARRGQKPASMLPLSPVALAVQDCGLRGLTRAMAARELGLSSSRVGEICATWPSVAAAFSARGWDPVSEAEIAAVREAAADGLTRADIIRLTGMSEYRVNAAVQRAGIVISKAKPGPKPQAQPREAVVSRNALSRMVMGRMSDSEVDDYRLLRKRYGYSIPDALVGMGRRDLLAMVQPQLERIA